jgi:predicted RNase H-like HicB family nuclease
MQLPVTLYQDEEGWFVVECPVIPGCASQGRSELEALDSIRDAISLCLDVRRERGLPLTIESRTVEAPAVAQASADLGRRGRGGIRTPRLKK